MFLWDLAYRFTNPSGCYPESVSGVAVASADRHAARLPHNLHCPFSEGTLEFTLPQTITSNNKRICVNTIYTDHTQLASDKLGRDSWERRQSTDMFGLSVSIVTVL